MSIKKMNKIRARTHVVSSSPGREKWSKKCWTAKPKQSRSWKISPTIGQSRPMFMQANTMQISSRQSEQQSKIVSNRNKICSWPNQLWPIKTQCLRHKRPPNDDLIWQMMDSQRLTTSCRIYITQEDYQNAPSEPAPALTTVRSKFQILVTDNNLEPLVSTIPAPEIIVFNSEDEPDSDIEILVSTEPAHNPTPIAQDTQTVYDQPTQIIVSADPTLDSINSDPALWGSEKMELWTHNRRSERHFLLGNREHTDRTLIKRETKHTSIIRIKCLRT